MGRTLDEGDRRSSLGKALGAGRELEIRELTDLEEVAACEQIQRAVWNPSETEIVGTGQLRAAQHAGGLIAGAFHAGEMVGFSYGFAALRRGAETAGLHSHMTAVLPSSRNLGVGRALKWFQRNWCLARGIGWVEWTFDPLRAANARLNLEHLGATVGEYLLNAYGLMDDDLNAGLPSDRLLAHWDLEDPAVVALSRGVPRDPPSGRPVVALAAVEEGPADLALPCSPGLGLTDAILSVQAPHDIGLVMARSAEGARAWRHAVRSALHGYFEGGYRATRFVAGSYYLERSAMHSPINSK